MSAHYSHQWNRCDLKDTLLRWVSTVQINVWYGCFNNSCILPHVPFFLFHDLSDCSTEWKNFAVVFVVRWIIIKFRVFTLYQAFNLVPNASVWEYLPYLPQWPPNWLLHVPTVKTSCILIFSQLNTFSKMWLLF